MSDMISEGGTGRLTRGLREQLQTMTAAAHALASAMDRSETADGALDEESAKAKMRSREYLAVLKKCICAQLRLVRQAELDERLNSLDEIRLKRGPTDLKLLCQDIMERTDELTRPLLGIRAEFTTSLIALPTWADEDALQEMLLIFISYSVQAIGHSGTIRLKLDQREDQAVISVTDSGKGLTPAVLTGLFASDEDEELEFPARGLLLARRIVELHGGTVAAANTEAGGARIVAAIPIAEQPAVTVRTPGIVMDSGGGWDPALVALSNCLPWEAFLPEQGGI